MLTKTDLIRLEHTPSLTEAGILSICQWLAYSSRPLGEKPYDYLRREIGNVIVDVALRRLLAERHIPFRSLEVEPFSNPPQNQLSLCGHRLHQNIYLLSNRAQIRSVRGDPSILLQASAITPLDQFVSEAQTSKDIYLFAFLLAVTARSQIDQMKLKTTDNPHYYLTVLPKNWSQPHAWISLNPIALKSEADHPVTVELGGLNADRNFICTHVHLQPRTRTIVADEFYSLAYIHIREHPYARLGIHSPRFKHHSQLHIIHPEDWGNLWVYGMDIWLTGWLSQEEYRHNAVVLPAGQSCFQYSRTRLKNLSVPMTRLQPIEELFKQILLGQQKRT